MHQHFKILLSLIVLSCFIIILVISRSQTDYIVKNDFTNFDNIKGYHNKIIPNIIHYIIFEKQRIDFSCYLSIISSLKSQKPSVLYIHTDQLTFEGENWNKIVQINETQPVIQINYISKPTHVYGQPISSIYHASDITRIKVLQEWGGIYLDTDLVLLKNLDDFRQFEMVVGWPKHKYMGTQILLANKNARFLTLWLQGYKRYIPNSWYYNAGQYPTEQLLEKMPYLAHRVPVKFGVHNLQNELYKSSNWTDWKQFYSLHLLSRHSPAPDYLNETLINELNNTAFKNIARYILLT